jgi:hypothetical protein
LEIWREVAAAETESVLKEIRDLSH